MTERNNRAVATKAEATILKTLAEQIKARLAKTPALAWDDAVAELARTLKKGIGRYDPADALDDR